MSRLRELRLHGFKSFADPTRFVFESGVNAVIGPNGSGKSNMADAVRWVLGEQSNRYLRTRRAEDVIFGGSQARRAQGMAEAILTLDNADGQLPIDFAEVSIGRRAYRSGESEYLINGVRARLRDIVDLLGESQLGANALVVVGQGTVDAALSLRPEERRQLFEEAAGVKTLQVRKNEALARLAKSRDNLVRVADLVAELRPQVRRLELQAQHQQEHATLGRRARSLIAESHRRRERLLRSELGEARRAAAAAEAALEAHRAGEEAGRTAMARAEVAYWDAERAAREAASARAATREGLIRAESRRDAAELRRSELITTRDRTSSELAAARQARASLADGNAVDAVVAPAISRAAAAEDGWRAAITRLADADARLLAAEEELAAVRRSEAARLAEAAREAERRAAADERRERLEGERANATMTLEALTAEHAAQTRAQAAADAGLLQAAGALEAAMAALASAATDHQAARERLAVAERRAAAVAGELEALRQRREHGDRLGARLAASGWRPLLDEVTAPEAAWLALEAVVGGELDQAVAWEDGRSPVAHVDGTGGIAHLLATGEVSLEGRAAALAAVGGERTLAEWIGTDALPIALRRVAIAPTLAALLAGWDRLPPGWIAVTEAGDLADGRGMLAIRGRLDRHGGESARLHARRRELSAEHERLATEREAATNAIVLAAREQERAADGLAAAGTAQAEADRSVREAHRMVEDLARRAEASRADLARVTQELAALSSMAPVAAGASEHAPSSRVEALTASAAEALADRDEAATARDVARGVWQAARGAAEEAEARSAGRRSDRALAEARIAQLEATLPEHERALAAIEDLLQAIAATTAAASEADERAVAALQAAEGLREAHRRELLERERSGGGGPGRLGDLERTWQAAAIAASRAEDALTALSRERELAIEGLPDAGMREDDAAAEEAADAELGDELAGLDDAGLDAELRRVRRTLSQIGSVNPFAVEEHGELAGRLDELTGQETDLTAAIGSTNQLITTLEAEIAGQFNAAFTQIAARFDEFCQLLFAGGSASLQLSDGEDGEAPGGIEIVVRPPRKRLQRLAMLSGGERALAGVALLFAMLSVNPVPFCILDEVDAALDEANIGRFADALRRLSQAIDFVVITHNRATIEVADTIYGVTMTDAAVSRVLSLRLADIPVEVPA